MKYTRLTQCEEFIVACLKISSSHSAGETMIARKTLFVLIRQARKWSHEKLPLS